MTFYSYSSLKKDLTTVFSEYIRLRDTDSTYHGLCITCNRRVFWKNADCGHWIPRGYLGTMYHEKNNHLQCKECNQIKEGMPKRYRLILISRYGLKLVHYLEHLKHNYPTIPRTELEDMMDDYTKRVALLHRVKEMGAETPKELFQ